ncbi:Carbon-nitrogen hydrolase [Amphibacillus marinus]|uniref:Carbon-nitrogen hydrolase n=1 Tax=Amphibacillus marinus TaxID=872970 RepID=A0A1H8M9T3_9BACI|nr:carbon-nitrogen family hydrolase [Amphibacillus marinus]SEO14089.1 Carbon-nitrogen hydrolase [Amphibacillus marinus]
MKLALIQMDIAFGLPEVNRAYVKNQVEKIVAQGQVDLIMLPELWTTGYDLTRFNEIAEDNGQDTITFIADLARKHQVHFVAGSIANRKHDKFYNTLIVINSNGEVEKQYDKAHLFRLMDEDKYLAEGEDQGLFILNNYVSAGVICYDIRFPEWIRTHMLNGAKLLYVVAEWPKARIDHWRTLLISRAIENQCYVIACNRVGEDANNRFGGHSLVVDPWGKVVAEAAEEPTTLYAEIDMLEVDRIRKTIPVYQDRRANLYRLQK